jgi:hypothetical protein
MKPVLNASEIEDWMVRSILAPSMPRHSRCCSEPPLSVIANNVETSIGHHRIVCCAPRHRCFDHNASNRRHNEALNRTASIFVNRHPPARYLSEAVRVDFGWLLPTDLELDRTRPPV